MSADDLARRREQLRRACEDGERLYRLLMHGGGGFGGITVADDHRLHGILTRELECALALVDELLRDALMRASVPDSLFARAPNLPLPPAGADEPEADPSETVAADPSVVDAESDTAYGDAMEHERQSWLRRVQAQPIER